MRASLRFLTMTAALLSPLPAVARTGWQTVRVASVTDGDTLRLTTGERIRIAGIDAPETQPDQAHCPAEIARGRAATARAKSLLGGRAVSVLRTGRSWNRTVARVRVGGRDVAGILVASGTARWWPRHTAKPDWCEDAR